MTRALTIGVAILALQACSSGPSLPQKPQIKFDRSSLGFGQEFGTGTFVGTSVPESLQITNGGQDPLTISSVTLTGDDTSVYTIVSGGAMPAGPVKSNDMTFVQILFAPTAVKLYTATLNIVSNAENEPNAMLMVSGKGVDIIHIDISPAMPVVQVNSTAQLTAFGTFSDGIDGGTGTVQNVNEIATWASADTNIATVDTNGKLSGVAGLPDGGDATTTVTATAHGITGQATVRVHN